MRTYSVATIPGDGIGQEVIPAGVEIVEAAGRKFGFEIKWTDFDWSCDRFRTTGAMMPENGIEILKPFDAIYLGAVGYPGVPDHISLWGLLIPLRREFDQYINMRPVRLMPGVVSPLRDRGPEDIDFVVVRENTEGEYSSVGGRMYGGTEREFVVQQAIFSRIGTDRVMRYAFELAKSRNRKKVTSATKSNGISHSMPYWDERFAAISADYPEIATDAFHIDILVAHFVRNPDWFDVVVASNLFGDILSDLGPAIAGSIGIAPAANINPERKFPSMFEPVHGSAPDIAGKGIANPVAAIWTASMMLDHLGEPEAGAAVLQAIEAALADPDARTGDLGGKANTKACTQAVLSKLS
ncbi:MAG: tartrate dehydrogenase [Alphaproteobacteria bacterium]|nr:tartrate dehydrogenase [Alphaproteobacteria bacterium]